LSYSPLLEASIRSREQKGDGGGLAEKEARGEGPFPEKDADPSEGRAYLLGTVPRPGEVCGAGCEIMKDGEVPGPTLFNEMAHEEAWGKLKSPHGSQEVTVSRSKKSLSN